MGKDIFTVQVSMLDIDIFKDIISTCKEFCDDARINESIRHEYRNKILETTEKRANEANKYMEEYDMNRKEGNTLIFDEPCKVVIPEKKSKKGVKKVEVEKIEIEEVIENGDSNGSCVQDDGNCGQSTDN